ncbi:hypothetical protein GVAV_000964 [Gurleya vavrai]
MSIMNLHPPITLYRNICDPIEITKSEISKNTRLIHIDNCLEDEDDFGLFYVDAIKKSHKFFDNDYNYLFIDLKCDEEIDKDHKKKFNLDLLFDKKTIKNNFEFFKVHLGQTANFDYDYKTFLLHRQLKFINNKYYYKYQTKYKQFLPDVLLNYNRNSLKSIYTELKTNISFCFRTYYQFLVSNNFYIYKNETCIFASEEKDYEEEVFIIIFLFEYSKFENIKNEKFNNIDIIIKNPETDFYYFFSNNLAMNQANMLFELNKIPKIKNTIIEYKPIEKFLEKIKIIFHHEKFLNMVYDNQFFYEILEN